MPNSAADALSGHFAFKNPILKPVSGGDINDAYELLCGDKHYFIKCNKTPQSLQMFLAEAKGLELIGSKGKANVPQVIDCFERNGYAFLALEWIPKSRGINLSTEPFWEQLARLHLTDSLFFGLDHDNFIGTLPQVNQRCIHWLDFYYQNRIDFQLKLAVNSGLIDNTFHKKTERMFKQVEAGMPAEKPALIHGDLWSGNLLFCENGQPYFIDPAAYFGCREMDLAMMQLFGGFGGFRDFEVYNALFPIAPNWKERVAFYQLYYILVHVNLFGYSYVARAQSIINYYGSRIE
jgi:protein-ribulosamine 3-kinase